MDKLDKILDQAGDPNALYPDEWVELAVELVNRLKATEAALDRVFPGWRLPGACLPDCKGACCEM